MLYLFSNLIELYVYNALNLYFFGGVYISINYLLCTHTHTHTHTYGIHVKKHTHTNTDTHTHQHTHTHTHPWVQKKYL